MASLPWRVFVDGKLLGVIYASTAEEAIASAKLVLPKHMVNPVVTACPAKSASD